MVSGKKGFIESLENIVEENISDEKFGVSELANKAGMSRSNLLRNIRKHTNMSASQFIRKIRLEHALELLKKEEYTVSEVAFRTGFNSVSYFVKCFHDHFGYPPGDIRREVAENHLKEEGRGSISSGRRKIIMTLVSSVIILIIVLMAVFKPFSGTEKQLENSIAVLPFKNDSNDSSNVYLINGLMESILNNLQTIEDLRIVSRTSVEKYRFTPMIIPDIARELNVNYFVEGSGQKIGDEIFLNIQLVEASGDKQLWSEQYRRKLEDVFELQKEIAESIAERVKAVITPEEEEMISKDPTDNMKAYDHFLKGLNILNSPAQDNLQDALIHFNRALEEDPEFARAYAAVAITYYVIDKNMATKKYTDQINSYADKALLYDHHLAQSLIAKALFYMSSEEYSMAISYFEQALDYNPNSDLVYLFLVDLYANYLPDTEKYLEYALKGLRLNMTPYDSITRSYSYLHISNAFIQSGFVDEAEKYINMSLDLYPGNIYSAYVKPYILFSRTKDLGETRDLLLGVLARDTNNIDVLQEVAKIYYYQRDYEQAFRYYSRFVAIRDYLQLDIYPGENGKIAMVYSKLGLEEEAKKLLDEYRGYAERDNSVYKNLSLAAYYSYTGDKKKALDYLKLFSEEENYHYWTVLFLNIDPLMDNISNTDEFRKIYMDLRARFDRYHQRIRSGLESEGLI